MHTPWRVTTRRGKTASHNRSHLMEMLRSLPDGVTEVACHPGFADDLLTMYRAARQVELDALCDPGSSVTFVR